MERAMAAPAKMPDAGDKVELVVDLPDYKLAKGDVGTILVSYSPSATDVRNRDYEIFFEKINMSVIMVESNFKLVG
ncbi:MAG: DUF4926 domain-containing protein [Candidatus Lokiarchaeota archaeon]|nr:DUF4926 domain-containing protein [Candidatus Lokiarchaeota archaeon]